MNTEYESWNPNPIKHSRSYNNPTQTSSIVSTCTVPAGCDTQEVCAPSVLGKIWKMSVFSPPLERKCQKSNEHFQLSTSRLACVNPFLTCQILVAVVVVFSVCIEIGSTNYYPLSVKGRNLSSHQITVWYKSTKYKVLIQFRLLHRRMIDYIRY